MKWGSFRSPDPFDLADTWLGSALFLGEGWGAGFSRSCLAAKPFPL